MIRAGTLRTLSLALIAGLFFVVQGYNETPVSANEEFVETDLPITLASKDQDDDVSLYVSSTNTNSVLAYDGTTGAFKGVFIPAHRGGLNEAEGMAFGPNGNLLVASELGNAVLEYNSTTGKFVRKFVKAKSGGLSEPTFITFGPAPAKG